MNIVADAGWDEVDLETALRFFSLEQIQDWWRATVAPENAYPDYESMGVPPELLEEGREDDLIDWEDEYDWTPQKVSLVTAKAVFEPHRWMRVLGLAYPEVYLQFKEFELQAILLGVELRKHLGDDSLTVVNDNRDACKQAKVNHPGIIWMRRSNVSKAHNLKWHNANKILA